MTIIWSWLRIDLRRRWRSLLVLALLIAVSAGTVLTAFAGARRGDSAVERLSVRTLPATADVQVFQPGFDWAAVRRLPQVEAMHVYTPMNFDLLGISPAGVPVPRLPADVEATRSIDRPVVLAGRPADQSRVDEAVVTPAFVESYGKGVGDTVEARLLTEEQQARPTTMIVPEPAGPRVTIRIVGVVRSPWYRDDESTDGKLIPTVAILEKYRRNLFNEQYSWFDARVRLRGGEAALPAFSAELARATGRNDISIRSLADERRRLQRTASFEAAWLFAFGVVAFAAAVVLVGQSLSRLATANVADLQVLRALGMSRRAAVLTAVAGPLVAALAGTAGGIAAAAVASYRFPIGSAGDLEPDPGLHVDALVLGPAALVVPLLVVAGAAATAWLALRAAALPPTDRRSVIAAAASRADLPVPVVIGSRFALESGRGTSALPARPALIGAVAGVLGVVAAFTFAAGASEAGENPRRFGQTWQLESWLGWQGQNLFSPGILATAARDRDVAGTNDIRIGAASAKGVNFLLYADRPVGGEPVSLVLAEGRTAGKASEVVLGPRTAEALDVGVGDTVQVRGNRGEAAFTVSGLGFVPAGSRCTDCPDHATGGWVTDPGFDGLFTTFAFRIGAVTVRPGADVTEVAARLTQTAAATPGSERAQFGPPYAPIGAAEIRRVRPLPIALGAFLVVLAVGAVGHALATAVRRRRHDVAVLRALGMTRRQSRAVVVTQASVLALTGLVFGVPLGLAAGRTAWRVVADYTPLEYAPPAAFWALLLVIPGTLVVANLLAAWPGHQAARLRIGHVLRTE